MKQRLYLDTSVFGGHFDEEFAEFTVPLFERLDKGEFILLFSSVTQDELENAPKNVRDLVIKIKKESTEFLEANGEAVNLATEYIEEKVVGQTSYADCLHIALATESNTPLKFRNFMTISLNEKIEQESYIDNEFYVYRIYQIKDNDFYASWFEKPTWFYVQ